MRPMHTLMKHRYMGTITEVSDADPVRWPSSYWRSVKVIFILLEVVLKSCGGLNVICVVFPDYLHLL